MRDKRIDKLADVLVNYSVRCGKGEKVLIESRGAGEELVKACVEKVFAAGGYPFVEMIDLSVERALMLGTGKEHCELRAKYAKYRMEDMDCYIGIRGGYHGLVDPGYVLRLPVLLGRSVFHTGDPRHPIELTA